MAEVVSAVVSEVGMEEALAAVSVVEHHRDHREAMAHRLPGPLEAMDRHLRGPREVTVHHHRNPRAVTDHLHRDLRVITVLHHRGHRPATDHHREARALEVVSVAASEEDMEVVSEVASEVDMEEVSAVVSEVDTEEASEAVHQRDHQEVMALLLLGLRDPTEHHPLEAVVSEVALHPPAMVHLPPAVVSAEVPDSAAGVPVVTPEVHHRPVTVHQVRVEVAEVKVTPVTEVTNTKKFRFTYLNDARLRKK